jgi:hypothetical protein
MKRFLEIFPAFLVLLPTFVVVNIEKTYHGLLEYRHLYGEMIWLFAFPPVALLITLLLIRDWRKASLAALYLMVVFYYLGPLKEYLNSLFPKSLWQSYSLLLPFALVLFIFLTLRLRRRSSKFARTFLFLNTALFLFIIADIGTITFRAWQEKHKSSVSANLFAGVADTAACPDIYYLIFDSYTSSPALKEYFGFDNTAIDAALIQRGFTLFPDSRSNYNLTPFSVGSTFHLDYLTGVDTTVRYTMDKYLPGVLHVYNNPLVPSLEKLGYSIFNHSLFDIRSHPSTVPSFDVWELNLIYQQHNLLKKIQRDIGWLLPAWLQPKQSDVEVYAANRDRHDSIALSHIIQSARLRLNNPRFVYGHLFIPHGPYTFDANGDKIKPVNNLPLQNRMKGYTGQVQHVNRLMLQVTDAILEAATRPTVIIIQGDHGFRFYDPDKKQLEFFNFQAIYLGKNKTVPAIRNMTNVNTFRLIGNLFFGTQLPILEGRTHFLQYQ